MRRRGLEAIAARRPRFVRRVCVIFSPTRRGGEVIVDVEDDDDAEGSDAKESTHATPADHDRSVESVSRWIARGERSASEDGGIRSRSASEDGVVRSRLAFGESSRVALDVVSRLDVFASLDRTRVRVMLREGARVETHPPGSVVTTRGDEGDAMYAILEGEAELADDDDDVESESSSRRVLTRGDAFGESCLLTGAPRRETVVATYRGATLVEIRAAAVAPMLRNARAFPPRRRRRRRGEGRPDDDDERKIRNVGSDSRRARRRVHTRVLRLAPRRRRRRRRDEDDERPRGSTDARRRSDAVPGRVRRARERRRVRVRIRGTHSGEASETSIRNGPARRVGVRVAARRRDDRSAPRAPALRRDDGVRTRASSRLREARVRARRAATRGRGRRGRRRVRRRRGRLARVPKTRRRAGRSRDDRRRRRPRPRRRRFRFRRA